MTVTNRYASSLRDLGSSDARRFGGKAASLGDLLSKGIRVPPGFALSTEAFSAGLGEAGVPAIVAAEVERRYDELAVASGELEPPVAVRSSARGEDSEDASFAGQQETFLWVRGADDVLVAVRDCWTSVGSSSAVAYRDRLAPGGEASAMGVVVQLMVDAVASGVMFTCNPVNGDPSVVVVDASWGLGQAVVGGEVIPDHIVLSKVTGELLRRTVGHKPFEHRPRPGGGTERAPVTEELRDAPCLDEDRLAALRELGQTLEAHAGGHRDVEWAIARSTGELFVLQSRPVTASGQRAAPPPHGSGIDLVMSTFGARAGERGQC